MGWEVTGKTGRWEVGGTQDVGRYVYPVREDRKENDVGEDKDVGATLEDERGRKVGSMEEVGRYNGDDVDSGVEKNDDVVEDVEKNDVENVEDVDADE